MQTFKDFLQEAKLAPASKELVKANANLIALIKKIKAECGPYITELKKMKKPGLLIRGVRWNTKYEHEYEHYGTFSKKDKKNSEKQSRSKRRPSDSTDVLQKLYDKWFNKNFGWKARSENSVFCFGNFNVVDKSEISYGDDWAFIFPKGELKYVYSQKVEDLFIYSQRNLPDIVAEYEYDSNIDKNIAWEAFDKYMKQLNFVDTGLADLMQSSESREISLHTKSYFYIDIKNLVDKYLDTKGSNYKYRQFNMLQVENMLWEALVNDEV